MRQTQLFTKTRKEDPKDEVSKNAKLLTRAGFIYKEMAGVYTFLPLGLRVLKKIENIVREEMNKLGGQEILLSALQDKESWQKTGRWDDKVFDVWLKTTLSAGAEVGLGPTHEEPLTKLLSENVSSYRDLPFYAYQIQTKFRNELRAKSGIMRGREFLMKDLYSFSRDEREHQAFYEKTKQAYFNVFEKIGLGEKTFLTFSSGGSFSLFSHEFQTICEAGEDEIYLSKEKNIAVNSEVYNDEVLKTLDLEKSELSKEKAAEVGNIFTLGTRFSDALGLKYLDESGDKKSVFMGSYGIGVSRLVGVLAEVCSDDKGLIWPSSVAPFSCHLLALGLSEEVSKKSDEIYKDLVAKGVEVLYDDRSVSAGEKMNDADLIGLPNRLIISEKTLKDNSAELKKRNSDQVEFISFEKLQSHAF